MICAHNQSAWKMTMRLTEKQASLLLSLKAFIALALLGAVLPAVGYIMSNTLRFSPISKDMWLARSSCMLMAGGSFVLGFSGTPAVMILGK
jgi:predicted acyltransferase